MNINYNQQGLVPVITQDVHTGTVLMQAWMNASALEKTLALGQMVYFSRSRNELWHKGATSGNFQKLVELYYDCDGDCLLAKVEQTGVACHTGAYSCFHNAIVSAPEAPKSAAILQELYDVIVDRRDNPTQESYTAKLLGQGAERIGKKVGEEAVEVVIAAMKRNFEEFRYEAADLMYHLMVLMVEQNVTLQDIYGELAARRK